MDAIFLSSHFRNQFFPTLYLVIVAIISLNFFITTLLLFFFCRNAEYWTYSIRHMMVMVIYAAI